MRPSIMLPEYLGHCAEVATCTLEFAAAGTELAGPIGTAIGAAVGAVTGAAIVHYGGKVISNEGGGGLAIQEPGAYYGSLAIFNKSSSGSTRGQALNDAKRDAGVPTSQQPEKQANVPVADKNGKQVVANGKPQTSAGGPGCGGSVLVLRVPHARFLSVGLFLSCLIPPDQFVSALLLFLDRRHSCDLPPNSHG